MLYWTKIYKVKNLVENKKGEGRQERGREGGREREREGGGGEKLTKHLLHEITRSSSLLHFSKHCSRG